ELLAAQLVARQQEGFGWVRGVRAEQLELAQHRRAVARDRGADARDDAVVAGYRAALVAQLETARRDLQITAQRIEHAHRMATLARRVHQTAGGVQRRIARK